MHRYILTLAILTATLLTSCNMQAQKVKQYKLKVVNTYNHDAASYTQGLSFYNGELYESAGQYGESSLRKVDLKTGQVLKRENLDSRYFAEGSVILGDRLYMLTWMERVCFIYDPATFQKIGQFAYNREGWGLTTDGTSLIASDGSAQIYYIDPATFISKKSITVRLNGSPVRMLNELEYISGKIWANIYLEDKIVIINPEDGVVEAEIDCKGLLPANLKKPSTDVLNGIAYNPKDGKIYLTGKNWPRLYEIELIEK
ncbi:MAG: glutaminyl-peptide cyclotransferase [Bacteroidales bacterium]|nr:glutaminyl-peptide cyclotransferase [Bacteroidales bacterium]